MRELPRGSANCGLAFARGLASDDLRLHGGVLLMIPLEQRRFGLEDNCELAMVANRW